MHRKKTSISMGGRQKRTAVLYTSEPCERDTMEGKQIQVTLLRDLTANIDLLRCGQGLFQKMTMRHDGHTWIVEIEAIEHE